MAGGGLVATSDPARIEAPVTIKVPLTVLDVVTNTANMAIPRAT